MSQPPSVGPRAGPIIAPTPKIACPTPCFEGGKDSTRIAWAVAIRAPPPSPWTIRQKISASTVWDAPHIADAAVKIRIEVTK